jgi:hypothetical protein
MMRRSSTSLASALTNRLPERHGELAPKSKPGAGDKGSISGPPGPLSHKHQIKDKIMDRLLKNRAVQVTGLCFLTLNLTGPGRFPWLHTVCYVGTAAVFAYVLLKTGKTADA